MKISIKHIVMVTLLQAGLTTAQSTQPTLKSYSVGVRMTHLYDLPSHRFDSELSQDMKGLNGDNTSLDLGFDIYAEKQFTPLWGVQAGFRKGGLTGANSVEYYSNSFSEGYADLIFNLNNMDKKRIDTRLNYYAKAGLGVGSYSAERYLVEDNSPNGMMEDGYWEGRLGAGLQYELNSYLRLELDVAYNIAFTDGFDGYNYSTGSDPYLSTGLGVAYTFGSKRDKPMYGVNFFSKEYFGVPEVPEQDREADSLMALELEASKARMEEMNRTIEEQEQAIDELKKEKNARQAVKTTQQEFVYFNFDSARLTEEAARELAKVLSDFEGQLTLVGYADNTGDSAYNQKLKERRAQAVKQFLVDALGFSEEAISIELASEIKDLKKNDFLNRKVVVEYQP